ncbi:MAG: hypothetical protein V1871_06440 [Planctomycetota bacterium]
MNTNCLFCGYTLKRQTETALTGSNSHFITAYNCDNCGEYHLLNNVNTPRDLSKENKMQIASYLLEQRLNGYQGIIVVTNDADAKKLFTKVNYPIVTAEEILGQFPKKITDKLDKALLNLSKLTKHFGQPIIIHYEFPAIFYAVNEQEFMALLTALKELDYVRETNRDGSKITIYITAKGYERIYELGKVNPTSHQGFVAMWFDPSMDDTYKNGFQKAIVDAGYEPKRIDKKEFIDDIDDEIIAEIRRSKFLVADFTDFRSGVFYESGFAKGLGIDVIFTCREDQKDKIKEHFDTRQKKHILWKDETDLYKQLKNSITANIGWGPKAKEEESK